MCRGFIGLNLNNSPETRDLMRRIMLRYMKNSDMKNNDDGYVFNYTKPTGKSDTLRTMEYKDVMNFIDYNVDHYTGVVHGHARLTSVGKTAPEYIHGWDYRGFTCSMNGTVGMADEFMSCDNDSLSLFKLIFSDEFYSEDHEVLAGNIKQLLESVVDYGNGALFMTRGDITIVANVNKRVTYHLINDSIAILNTNDDIHSLFSSDIVEYKHNDVIKSIEKNGLKLERVNATCKAASYNTKVEFESDYSADWDDAVTVFDNNTGAILHQIKVQYFPTAQMYMKQFGGQTAPGCDMKKPMGLPAAIKTTGTNTPTNGTTQAITHKELETLSANWEEVSQIMDGDEVLSFDDERFINFREFDDFMIHFMDETQLLLEYLTDDVSKETEDAIANELRQLF